MREILFRGKRADNGEWVYGRSLSDDVIAPKGQEYTLDDEMYAEGLIGHVVDPETVGQYTGLIDKNGKKIFEGDICQIKSHPLIEDTPFFIKWEVEHRVYSGWAWKDLDKEAREDAFTPSCASLCEVIGNIHDNPELLKGDNDAEVH